MDDKPSINKIAKDFWNKFMLYENIIYKNIMKRNSIEYNQSINIVEKIIQELNIKNMVSIHFGIDTRNGMVLDERKDHIELIISPMFQRSYQKLVWELYNESFNQKLPKYRSVIKYKFYRPSYINNITLNYEIEKGKEQNLNKKRKDQDKSQIIEITKDDFYYYPILNDQKKKLHILLFVKDDKANCLIKIEKYKDREIWMPKDNGIHAILDSAIGEYNLLNVLDKMEIHLESDLDSEEFKDIDSLKLENIVNEMEMIHNHSLSDFHKCSRCEYSNKQVKLYICKCKKVYYCDTICQQAHRKLHLLGGCK
jgi:hypothetical protein